MIQDVQEMLFKNRTVSTGFRNPDYVRFAEACGAAGYGLEEPSVVDIVIDPTEKPPFDASTRARRRW